MKIKISRLIGALIMCFSLVGCNDSKTSSSHGDNPNDVIYNSDVGVTIDGFTNFDNTIAGKIPNNQTSFVFGDNVKTSEKCSWKLYKNLTGSEEIITKTIECSIGDNTVYLFAQSEKESKLYTVIIRRRPLYTVTYDYSKSLMVEEDDLLDEASLETPSKTGYLFSKWDYDFSKPVVSDLVIHAVWVEKEYTISFDLDGGNLDSNSMKVKWGQYYQLPLPKKSHYCFRGWYCGDVLHDNHGYWKTDSDISLRANWSDEWYVLLEPGKNKAGQYLMVNGQRKMMFDYYFKYGEHYELPEVEEPGYIFEGWFSHQDHNVGYGDWMYTNPELFRDEPFPLSGTWTFENYFCLYAKMRAKSININLNPDGGICSSESLQVDYYETMRLPTPTREGYTFVGWFYGDEGPYLPDIDYTCRFPNDVELRAKWQVNDYKIYLSHFTSELNSTISLYSDKTFTFSNSVQKCPDLEYVGDDWICAWCLDRDYNNFYDWKEPLKTGTKIYGKPLYQSEGLMRVYNNTKNLILGHYSKTTIAKTFIAPYPGEYNLYFEFEFGDSDIPFNVLIRKGKNNSSGELIEHKEYSKDQIDESITINIDSVGYYTVFFEFNDYVEHKVRYGISQNCYLENFYDSGKLAYYATYGNNYSLGVPDIPSGKTFVGWYTQENGQGICLTDSNGNSLAPFALTNNINLYAFFQ